MSNLFVMGPAPEVETLPPDASEREQALDIGRSWIVEAPAGSGKTGLLIQRYLKLLAEESVVHPGQVLAITFTKKAAAEIRERVLAQLESALRGDDLKDARFERETRIFAEAVLEKDRRLEWGLLESPQRMNLKTIDSLCAVIAGSMPVLSGGGGAKSPAEDALPLYQAAARRTVMQLGGEDTALNDALRLVLLHRDGNLAECERMLAGMLAVRDQWGELIPLQEAELNDAYLDDIVLPKLERTLEQIVCAGLTELAQSVPPEFMEEIAALADSFAQIEPYNRPVSPIASCAGRSVPGTDAEHLEQWRALIHLLVVRSSWTWRKSFAKSTVGFATTKTDKQQWKAVIEQIAHREDLLEAMRRVDRLPPAKYPPEQWVVAKALFRLLSRALVELQLVFAERGECDFAELALLARGALRQPGGVLDLQEALGMEFRHLLIDEMQDTSTIQYELIELLTQEWDGEQQTVFLVGDPKQSIYLFRQARVERFVRTMREQRLGHLPVNRLRLTANFRSQGELVEAFNTDFSMLFPAVEAENAPDEIPYGAAAAVRTSAFSEIGARWHTRVMEERRFSKEAILEKRRWQKDEAQTIRAIAREWRLKPLPEGRRDPWKIAVLVQTRRHLLDVVAAFKQDDGDGPIPFTAVKIDELAERQEVMDLLALTRALLHPADRVAWLAVLRAPWCGLGLVDLHAVAGGDDPDMAKRCVSELMIERRHLLSDEGQIRLHRVTMVMQAAEARRERLTTSQWVERTWRSLGGDMILDEAELGNARRYLQLLDEVENPTGRVDLPGLQRRMEKLFAQSVPRAGAVDLMTIHGAKGLEWDVVMVPGLARGTGRSQSGLLVWNEIEENQSDAAHGVLAPIAGRGEPAKELNQWMKGLRDAREAAERKRLFYVACTRAREELHLFAAPSRSAGGEVLRDATSLLKAAWPAAERHFAADKIRTIIPLMPRSSDHAQEEGLTIAAGATVEETGPAKPITVERLPLSFDPSARFRASQSWIWQEPDETFDRESFERPEGSFAARAFGNAVHAFMELAARRISAAITVESLALEVSAWGPRIEAVLRGDGLPPSTVKREAQRVLAAIQTALGDRSGRWVLGAQEGAATEYGFTTWTERRKSFRLDRVFLAGAEPSAPGNDHLWIVDYKTGTHGRGVDVETFLNTERQKYGSQMDAYARAMAAEHPTLELRVGLYYPLLPRLLWWKPA